MRIICDHCDHPITGTVKVLAGNFNLHPDCMTELGKGTNQNSTAVSWQCQESSVSASGERNAALPGVSCEMK